MAAATTDSPEPASVLPVAPGHLDRRLVLAGVVCAAATLGVPLGFGVILLRISAAGVENSNRFGQLMGYSTAAAVIAALLVLRLYPRLGWAWLLGADQVLMLPAMLAGIAVGWLAGIGRWRAWLGMAGLAICAVVLLVAPAGDPAGGATTLTALLLVVGTAAAVAGIAAVAANLIEPPHIPAAFGSLTVAVQTGGAALVVYLMTVSTG